MKKLFYFLVGLGLVLVLFSCEKEDVVQERPVAKVYRFQADNWRWTGDSATVFCGDSIPLLSSEVLNQSLVLGYIYDRNDLRVALPYYEPYTGSLCS